MTENERWLKRNSFDEENQDYVEKVLTRFELPKYHYIYNNGELALIIEQGLRKYKIIANAFDCRFEIYRCEVRPFGKHTKENMVLKKTFKDDCIWESIKWVAKDSKV